MDREDIEEIILEPDPARVMEGLRDTGYDFNTALADLVDNSIAADATEVDVKIEMIPISGEIHVYIADNGHGMNLEGLKNAMKYGSARRDDPSSLGKFGLGLKTASTAFCRKLSLLSKTNESDYNKVCWDLDEICRINKWKLLQPELDDDEIDILEQTSKGKAGTLVIWEKVDRVMKMYSNPSSRTKAFQRIVDSVKKHFSMVYQRFLDPQYTNNVIKIRVNGEPIKPWDPFCKSEPNTHMIAREEIPVELPNGSTSSFVVEAYLLPRVEEFSSPKAKSEAHISNDYEGFYIYRENRLIHFGGWLGIFVSDPHISLLRVNFSFDHTLDEAFNVDIKKSGINLAEEIYQYLEQHFLPAPRREAQEIYRKGQNAAIQREGVNAHAASNANINSKAPALEAAKVEVINPETGKVSVSNNQGTFSGTIKIRSIEKPGQTRVIPVGTIEGNMLWEPTIVDGNHAVSINQGHPYYQKVYAPILGNSVLVTGMDALLWALAEAEMSTYSDETKEQYEEMRIQVSRILKKLVSELPDPEFKEE